MNVPFFSGSALNCLIFRWALPLFQLNTKPIWGCVMCASVRPAVLCYLCNALSWYTKRLLNQMLAERISLTLMTDILQSIIISNYFICWISCTFWILRERGRKKNTYVCMCGTSLLHFQSDTIRTFINIYIFQLDTLKWESHAHIWKYWSYDRLWVLGMWLFCCHAKNALPTELNGRIGGKFPKKIVLIVIIVNFIFAVKMKIIHKSKIIFEFYSSLFFLLIFDYFRFRRTPMTTIIPPAVGFFLSPISRFSFKRYKMTQIKKM